ncbi:glutathione synthetase ATP-binding domain-like protein [Gonapodya prolifera JEL478]|uniref:Glutathione synthetase ATP-binding domain-like protein n=1 Tax=Gonapodya prolifera (strain JEL478) TaxID=1344416 RepID=A0A138ZZ12_GONPJ|nr:glutathione synthetase ATP-binding domain-like protein [Gonapodya prolifera JEL478]|eukprot:KXS09747.1 glutathione synthetase ATP-binding domain-like protein [Gonapodya prolifera JEL478]
MNSDLHSPSSASTLASDQNQAYPMKDSIPADLPPLPTAATQAPSRTVPTPSPPTLSDVHVLIPTAMVSGAAGNQFIIDNDEWAGELREFTDAFTRLGATSVEWHRVTLHNFSEVIQKIHQNRKAGTLAVNLCDGYETTDGRPGNSVIKLLESRNIPFTGASSRFNSTSCSKTIMKRLFHDHKVPTAAYSSIPPDHADVGPHLWSHIPIRPLIVKPDGGYNSIGTTVCRTDAETEAAIRNIQSKYGRVIVEPFIKGREYTALVVDNPTPGGEPVVFPVMERSFPTQFTDEEKFMSRDVWNNLRFEGKVADAEVGPVLEDVARNAYKAVGGNGYGRVDIRVSPPLLPQVLEVNSLCGLSEDRTSTVGFMLAAAELKIIDVWRLVARQACDRAKQREGGARDGEDEMESPKGVWAGEGVQLSQ